MSFSPVTGTSLVTIKFAGPNCKTLTVTVAIAKVGELFVAGQLDNEAQVPIELKVESTETLGESGLIEFPTTLRTKVFVEEKGAAKEVKKRLLFAGKTFTLFRGRLSSPSQALTGACSGNSVLDAGVARMWTS